MKLLLFLLLLVTFNSYSSDIEVKNILIGKTVTNLQSVRKTFGKELISVVLSNPDKKKLWSISVNAWKIDTNSVVPSWIRNNITFQKVSPLVEINTTINSDSINLKPTSKIKGTHYFLMVLTYFTYLDGSTSSSINKIEIFPVDTPLPVVLNTFTATLRESSVLLNWNISMSINNSFFEIQKSADNQFWRSEERVVNIGTGDYAAIDKYLVDFIFYRLKIVDLDNSYTYSPVRVIYPIFNDKLIESRYYDLEGRRLPGAVKGYFIKNDYYSSGKRLSIKYHDE